MHAVAFYRYPLKKDVCFAVRVCIYPKIYLQTFNISSIERSTSSSPKTHPRYFSKALQNLESHRIHCAALVSVRKPVEKVSNFNVDMMVKNRNKRPHRSPEKQFQPINTLSHNIIIPNRWLKEKNRHFLHFEN